jgi:hypothetical protein
MHKAANIFFAGCSNMRKIPLYTNTNYRQEAIKKGHLIDITTRFPEYADMFHFPVCFNYNVWKLVTQVKCDNRPDMQKMLVESILRAMSRDDVRKKGNMRYFSVKLIDADDQLHVYFLESMLDTGDNGEPVYTVGLQDEGYVY